MSEQRGYTLIEIMVTLSILVILMAIAVPSFNNATLTSRLRSIANELSASATIARSEAFKRNAPTTLCVSTNGTSCSTTGTWEQGWIVLAGSTVITTQSALPNGFKVNSAGGTKTFQFQPTGANTSAATLTICRSSPSAGREERVVTINAAGRVTIRRTATGACA